MQTESNFVYLITYKTTVKTEFKNRYHMSEINYF
jgi:hypothetical protein